MRGDDIRRLCDAALGDEPPADAPVVETVKTAATSADDLLSRVDAVLDDEPTDPPETGRDGKVALAMLLAAGDVLAQGDIA